MHRIVHLSDLHFPPRDTTRYEALLAAIAAAPPSLIVITGDLTRAGRRREFRAARGFADRLPQPVFVVAGNHDVPVFNPAARLFKPLARFDRFFPGALSTATRDGALVMARLDTARGIGASWDWSLGDIDFGALRRLMRGFAGTPERALRMVACHHPLLADPADPQRSRTRGGAAALSVLARLGVSIVFHGHLHRAGTRLLPVEGRHILSIGAGTLSERERGAEASFNAVTLTEHEVKVVEMAWDGRRFSPARFFIHERAEIWPEPSARWRIDCDAGASME